MEYTIIPQEEIDERDKICSPLQHGDKVRMSLKKGEQGYCIRNSITYFCYHQLGIKPYVWQHMLWKEIHKGDKDIIVCTPRQVGKTFAVAVAALYYTIYNLLPLEDGAKKGRTIMGIVSKSNDQAIKVLDDIRALMYLGDQVVEQRYGIKKFFTNHISNKQSDSNNRTHLTLRKMIPVIESIEKKKAKSLKPEGAILGEIICIPPTESARGHTFSKLFGDEAAFFENDDFFSATAIPTLRKTRGKMILTSTPNGQKGYFHKIFDPDDEYDDNPYYRLWLHYSHIEDDRELDEVLLRKDKMERAGQFKKFQQEYEAMFTVDTSSFFDSEKVDEGVDDSLQKWLFYDKPTDMGIDFGFKNSLTIITISRLGEDGISRLIYHKIYPAKDDIDIYPDVLELIKNFSVQRVIIDDCPAASSFTQKAIKDGKFKLHLMSFKKDKVSKYVQFRGRLYSGKIKYYKDKKLISEMKAMEEEETQRSTRISKPTGGSDDFIDSFMMSLYFQIDDKKGLRVYDWDEV